MLAVAKSMSVSFLYASDFFFELLTLKIYSVSKKPGTAEGKIVADSAMGSENIQFGMDFDLFFVTKATGKE